MLRMVPSWYSLIWATRTQEIPVKGNHVINVSLKKTTRCSTRWLSWVMLWGASARCRVLFDRIKKEDMSKGVVTRPAEALKGKVAGVVISQAGGDPTSSPSIRVQWYLFSFRR